jgi:hypothetical protein
MRRKSSARWGARRGNLDKLLLTLERHRRMGTGEGGQGGARGDAKVIGRERGGGGRGRRPRVQDISLPLICLTS